MTVTAMVEEIVPGRTAVAVYARRGLTSRRLSLLVTDVRWTDVQVAPGVSLHLPLLVLEDGSTVVADPRLPVEVVTP